jgi:hypothetical protein
MNRSKQWLKALLTILVLLMVSVPVSALKVKKVIIVPPEEAYRYGSSSHSMQFSSVLGRQVFRSMQKGIVLFNKSPKSRRDRVAVKNSGYAEASNKYNAKIKDFYRFVSGSNTDTNQLYRLTDSENSHFVLWFEFSDSYKRSIGPRGSSTSRNISGTLFLFDARNRNIQEKTISLLYQGHVKTFSIQSRNDLSIEVKRLLESRL